MLEKIKSVFTSVYSSEFIVNLKSLKRHNELGVISSNILSFLGFVTSIPLTFYLFSLIPGFFNQDGKLSHLFFYPLVGFSFIIGSGVISTFLKTGFLALKQKINQYDISYLETFLHDFISDQEKQFIFLSLIDDVVQESIHYQTTKISVIQELIVLKHRFIQEIKIENLQQRIDTYHQTCEKLSNLITLLEQKTANKVLINEQYLTSYFKQLSPSNVLTEDELEIEFSHKGKL